MTGCRALPAWASVLAVVAHPDDESFGLGAVLASFADRGAATAVLCFTGCHPSQAVPGSVLWRRLDLLGDREHLRWVHGFGPGPTRGPNPCTGGRRPVTVERRTPGTRRS